MAVLGGILLIAALAIVGFCLWAASLAAGPAVTLDLFNNTLSITATTMFLLGALAMLLLLLGIWLAFFATKRRYRSHKERRTLEKREREQAAELQETRAKLNRQEQDRSQPRREEPVREQVRRDEPVRTERVDEREVRRDDVRDGGLRNEQGIDTRPDVDGRDVRRDAPHGSGDYIPPRDGRR